MSKETQNLVCSICGSYEAPVQKNGIWCCKYCGAMRPDPHTIPSETKISLNIAHNQRHNADYDNAIKTYDNILRKNPDLEEANWGALVAEYGIEFIEENGKFIPTLHRLNANAVNKMPYYAKLSKEHKELADKIEDVRLKVWQQYEKVPPYDVFICYKETEVSGKNKDKPTQESKWARDLYEILTYKCNLKVFYAPKSLVISNELWEGHIYAALRSARFMIVLATSLEHVNAPWVKNEWSRFAEFAKEDKKQEKIIRVMLSGLDPAELPAELRNRQSFDRDQSWEDALFSSIKEIFDAVPQMERKDYSDVKVGTKQAIKQTITKRQFGNYSGKSSISEKTEIENARVLGLELGKFDLTIQMCNSIIAKNKSCHEAYWIKLLAENKSTNEDMFKTSSGLANMATLEAAIATANDKKQSKIINILHDKILKTNDFILYKEFVTFPCVTEKDYCDLTKHLFKMASDKCNTNSFDVLIKTVSDVDEYLNMHEVMISRLESDGTAKNVNKISQYLKNILDHDQGNEIALWKNYCIKNKLYSEDDISSYILSLTNYKEIEALYEYGYNITASKALLAICHEGAKNNNKSAFSLFDCLIGLIPSGYHKLYEDTITDFISVLFKSGHYDQISKYNDQLLALDEYNHRAHFNRLLIKYKTYNLLSFLKVYDKLLLEENFNAAINAYSEKNSGSKNIYRQFYIELGKIRDRINSDAKTCSNIYKTLFMNPDWKKEIHDKLDAAYKRNNLHGRTRKRLQDRLDILWNRYDQKMKIWNLPVDDYYSSVKEVWIPDKIGGEPPKNVGFSANEDAQNFYSELNGLLADVAKEGREKHQKQSKNQRVGSEVLKVSIIIIIIAAIAFGVIFGINQFNEWRSGMKLELSEDGTYYVCTGPNFFWVNSEIVIPGMHNGLPVKVIGEDAFVTCTDYKSVYIPDSVVTIGSSAFRWSTITSITIPDSVRTIDHHAFSGCTKLTSVVIGSGVTDIDYDAFYGCESITDVFYHGTKAEWQSIAISSGNDCLLNATIHFSDGYSDNDNTDQDGEVKPPVDTGKGLYDADGCLVASWNELVNTYGLDVSTNYNTSINIPTSTSQLYFIIKNNPSLKRGVKLVIDDSVTSIGNKAFEGCDTLTTVVIPNSVTRIGSSVFLKCHGLTSVVIPESVKSIGSFSFLSCNNLTDVYYTGTEAQWKKVAIGEYNQAIVYYATIHYNYIPE